MRFAWHSEDRAEFPVMLEAEYVYVPSGKRLHSHGKIHPFLRTVNHLFLWIIFHGYVKLPEGIYCIYIYILICLCIL